jgi:hypothetical protein
MVRAWAGGVEVDIVASDDRIRRREDAKLGSIILLVGGEGNSSGIYLPPSMTQIPYVDLLRSMETFGDPSTKTSGPIKFQVDTTNLTPGILKFRLGDFLDRMAVELKAGQQTASIDGSTAASWGLAPK